MRSILARAALAVVCSAFPLGACTANVHDNTLNVDVPNLSITTDADVNNIHQGESIGVNIHADTNASTTPPPPSTGGGSSGGGSSTTTTTTASFKFKIFPDDENSDALAVTTSTHVQVTIPASTSMGSHKLICRAFHDDDTPTDSKTEIDINVTASVTTTTTTSSGDH